MRAVGIDLGTTNSLVAWAEKGTVSLIPNRRGKTTTPSAVAFRDGEVLVGESAKNQAVVNPHRTVLQVKRAMGSVQRWEIDGKVFTPAQLSALILRSLRQDAEDYLGFEVRQAVITVPAYFSEPQRKDTLLAAKEAGFEQVRLINEPTAAALAWDQERQLREGLFLVYDWGGGTFDVSLIRLREGDFYVLGTAGDSQLGGCDLDELIFQEALRRFEPQCGTIEDPALLQQLRLLAEQVKIELSVETSASLSLPFAGSGRLAHLQTVFYRREFEQWIRPSVDRTLQLCTRVLEEAGVAPAQVKALVLSGGSTRIPLVRRTLEDWLGLKASQAFNPEEAVCRGAALYAALGRELSPRTIVDVTAFDLGVEIEGGVFFPLIRANSPVPIRVSGQFTTVQDQQTIVEIHVQQRQGQDVSSLGRFLLEGISPASRGVPRIEVSFHLDGSGILTVSARDVHTGVAQELTITHLPVAGCAGDWRVLEELVRRARQIRWERLPLALLRHKHRWAGLVLEAEAVLQERQVERRDELVRQLHRLLEELEGQPVANAERGTHATVLS